MKNTESMKDYFSRMIEREDLFDGYSEGDVTSSMWDAYNESLERDVGSLWEETV